MGVNRWQISSAWITTSSANQHQLMPQGKAVVGTYTPGKPEMRVHDTHHENKPWVVRVTVAQEGTT